MGIVVACRCGQAFEADAWLAGKVVQCPTCHSPIAVPSPTSENPAMPPPRPRTVVSRDDRGAMEPITIILVVGAAILVVVLCLSTFIFVYLKRTNPIARLDRQPELNQPIPKAPAAQQPLSIPARPVPIGPSGTGEPVANPPVTSAVPEGWTLFEHPTAKFSALLPESMEVIERKVNNLAGQNTVHILTATLNGHVYEAAREIRPYSITAGQEAATCEIIIEKRARELNGGKVEATSNVMIEGRLVCDATLRGGEQDMEVRKYLRLIAQGDSVFELSCRVQLGKERPEEIRAFLGTYRLE